MSGTLVHPECAPKKQPNHSSHPREPLSEDNREGFVNVVEQLASGRVGIFIGSVKAATNFKLLAQHRISHILIVHGGLNPEFPGKFKYCKLNAPDVPESAGLLAWDGVLADASGQHSNLGSR